MSWHCPRCNSGSFRITLSFIDCRNCGYKEDRATGQRQYSPQAKIGQNLQRFAKNIILQLRERT